MVRVVGQMRRKLRGEIRNLPRFRLVWVGLEELNRPLRQRRASPLRRNELPVRRQNAQTLVAPVGNIDVAFRIERNIGRAAEQEIPKPAMRLHMPPLRRKLLDRIVIPISDVDVVVAVDGEPPRLVQAMPRSHVFLAAKPHDELPVGSELADAMAVLIGDIDIVLRVDRNAGRPVELPRTPSMLPPLVDELPFRVVYHDAIVELVRNVQQITAVERHGDRKDELPRTAAVPLAELEEKVLVEVLHSDSDGLRAHGVAAVEHVDPPVAADGDAVRIRKPAPIVPVVRNANGLDVFQRDRIGCSSSHLIEQTHCFYTGADTRSCTSHYTALET